MDTAKTAGTLFGPKLYQMRAQKALPVLVRQAIAHKPIYYIDLAEELYMPNPRNLNYVLGCIGETLQDLSIEWNELVPPITCLVISLSTGLPGKGIGLFLGDQDSLDKMP